MIVLALETASSVCSVALLKDGRIEAVASLHRPRAHAEYLVPMMADVMRYGAVRPPDVTAVAVSSGPGSYTGLRIGVSTAKGFASASGAQLISVSSLRALAQRVRPGAKRNDRIAAAFDARRGEAYAALFRVGNDADLKTLKEATIVRSDDAGDWLGDCGSEALYLVGDGWEKMNGKLDSLPHRYVSGEDGLPSADAVARIGAAKLEAGLTEDVVTFEPYYLKEFVATRPTATAFEKLSF